MARLPNAFSDLDRFVDEWVLADSSSRAAKRQESDYADIKEFYDAMLALAPDALRYLSTKQLGELDEAEERLLKLLLSLAELGPAVEWYQQAQVIDGFPAARFPIIRQLSDNVPQE